jgi:hypothetical protein
MLGRQDNICLPTYADEATKLKYQRCMFADMKLAIDYLKEFNDKLNQLHPDILYKIKQIF